VRLRRLRRKPIKGFGICKAFKSVNVQWTYQTQP
jgi:hypothetical protein